MTVARRVSSFLLLLASSTLLSATNECNFLLAPPCRCISSRFDAVSITCDKGDSLGDVLQSLARPPSLIDSLTISNTPIDELPPYAFRSLHIRSLVLRNNGLTRIARGAFDGPLLNSLEQLEIRSNHLESIPQAGIAEIRALRSLVLADNAISIIPNNAFLSYHSRTTIRSLDLSANNMSVIFPQAFLGLEDLEQLALDKNRLRAIPQEALSILATLEELSMSVNEIETIGVGVLQLPNLKSLSLEVNRIRSIAPDALQTLPNLAYLYLGSNFFNTIEGTMFFYVNQLKLLSMSNNHELRIVPSNAFQYIPNLLRLELSECSISVIEPSAFHKISKVQVINLARNHLTQSDYVHFTTGSGKPAAEFISHDTFSALPAVVSIDLQGNKISTVDDFAFSQLSALSTLDLSLNRLETMPKNAFFHSLLGKNGKTRIVYLYNNPWLCDKQLLWLRKWLRDNPDVEISRSYDFMAKCWTPADKSGDDLRDIEDDVEPSPSTPANLNAVHGDRMRKLIKTPPVTATSIVEFPPVVLGTDDARTSSFSLVFLILGIVFGLLLVCITLLLIIRCIVRAREEKTGDGSRFGGDSVTSSGFTGSAYSTTGIYPDHASQIGGQSGNQLPPSHTPYSCSPRGVPNIQPQVPYLNRPRYWWF